MGTVRDPSSRRRFAQIVLRFVTERSGTRPCPAAPVGSEEPGSINVSAAAATRPELFDLLCRHDSSARLVVVELTEQTDVSDCPALIPSLAAMHERGIRIAVDGTGAGFASLRHLLNLRPEFVKLDIYLVRNVDADPARRALAPACSRSHRRLAQYWSPKASKARRNSSPFAERHGTVSTGVWFTDVNEIGAVDSSGAPMANSAVDLTARTPGFDATVTSSTGDIWAVAVDPNADLGTPVTIQPGQTTTISVTITPTGAHGTMVSCVLTIYTTPSFAYASFNTTGDVLAHDPRQLHRGSLTEGSSFLRGS